MKKNILVIDDEKVIRNSFLLTFENSEYQVDTAESGRAGLNKIIENKYDLVFLDLKMPEMDGVETLRLIRNFSKDIQVYIFTAFHKEYFNDLESASRQGLRFEIVQKPLDADQLRHLVTSILRD
jgi:DNA-binding NtrC family response regulator